MDKLILICDDSPVVHETLGAYLKSEGFTFVSATNGPDSLKLYQEHQPELIILDIMMPGLSGIDVMRRIRKESSVPVLLLSARGDEVDRILGLELGADDYIVKPFSPREVVARVKAVLRRKHESAHEAKETILRAGKLSVNIAKYEVLYDGKPIICTPKEVEILNLLLSRPGQVFDRETILNKVWGYDYYGDTRAVDTQIKRIRHKLPQDDSFAIRTLYGVGYKFEVRP